MHGGREDVHAEEAKVVASAQARNVELLLGFRGSRFFEDGFNLIELLRGINELTADRAVERQLALMRGLHGGDGAILSARDFHKLLRASLFAWR